MADILTFPRKPPDFGQVSTATNHGEAKTAQLIEDLECGLWTTRKLKIPTSTSGSLVIECFESADGKRLKGSGEMEPDFCLSNLQILVQNALGFDSLKLFPMHQATEFSKTDFMSHVVSFPKQGRLIVILSLTLRDITSKYKLWF